MPRARPTPPPQEGCTGAEQGASRYAACVQNYQAPAGTQLFCESACVRACEAFACCSWSVHLTAMLLNLLLTTHYSLLTSYYSLLTCCSWSVHLTAMDTTDARLVASSTSRLLKSTVPSRSYRSLLLMSCRQPMHLPPRSSSMMGTQRMERVRYPLLRSHCRYTYSGEW